MDITNLLHLNQIPARRHHDDLPLFARCTSAERCVQTLRLILFMATIEGFQLHSVLARQSTSSNERTRRRCRAFSRGGERSSGRSEQGCRGGHGCVWAAIGNCESYFHLISLRLGPLDGAGAADGTERCERHPLEQGGRAALVARRKWEKLIQAVALPPELIRSQELTT